MDSSSTRQGTRIPSVVDDDDGIVTLVEPWRTRVPSPPLKTDTPPSPREPSHNNR